MQESRVCVRVNVGSTLSNIVLRRLPGCQAEEAGCPGEGHLSKAMAVAHLYALALLTTCQPLKATTLLSPSVNIERAPT